MSRKARQGGKKRGFRWWYILIALLVIGALARPKAEEPDKTTPNNSVVSATVEPSPTPEPTAEPTPEPTAEPTPVEYTEPPAETEPPETQAPVQTETMVWIPTNGGTKYHSKSSCSNMDNPQQVTLSEAQARGFTPCGRCY